MENVTPAAQWVSIFFENFGLSMFIVAVIVSIIQMLITKKRAQKAEIIFSWVVFFAVGVTGLYTGFLHAFYPEMTASNIGWPTSPFQWEVGMADLALGFLGIFAVKASQGFRIATVLAAVVFLWGDALGHLYQLIKYQNFSPGNAGSWFWMDIIISIVLLISLSQLKNDRRLFS